MYVCVCLGRGGDQHGASKLQIWIIILQYINALMFKYFLPQRTGSR